MSVRNHFPLLSLDIGETVCSHHDYWEDATHDTVEFLYKLCVFETFISIQLLLKAFNSLFTPKLLFIEVFGVSVQLYLDL